MARPSPAEIADILSGISPEIASNALGPDAAPNRWKSLPKGTLVRLAPQAPWRGLWLTTGHMEWSVTVKGWLLVECKEIATGHVRMFYSHDLELSDAN